MDKKPSSILAIDQGTTSSRAIVFDDRLQVRASAQQEFEQFFPRSGWVEHDAEEIWATTLAVCREALGKAGVAAADVAAIGITNQRETTLIWDRETGKPIHKAIVWQDRRTADHCTTLKEAGHEPKVTEKTGLLLDPYFSGTKIAWLLENVEGAREKAEAGNLAFGTIDCFLIWRLTGGKVHATDATNASRTMLCNIHSGTWDEDLLDLLNVPASLMPEIRDCAGDFGTTAEGVFEAPIAIRGVAGDQQAATIGQACFEPGMIKSTYGTGCFALLNTGKEAVPSTNRLLTTIAYQLDGERTYALEGSIFIAGAAVQWLRDGLGLIDDAAETGGLAAEADPEQHVYLVPAFTGLGAPWWDAEARGVITGLARNSGPKEFARAALESVGYQTRDLLDAMRRDMGQNMGQNLGESGSETVLRVDGGMVASDWTMQFLADILGAPVDRPRILETTALGAAYLAGYAVGLYPAPAEFAKNWALERRFEPAQSEEWRARKWAGWQDAMRRTLTPKE